MKKKPGEIIVKSRIVNAHGEPLYEMGERCLLPGDRLTINDLMVRSELLIDGKPAGWIEGKAEFEWVAEPDKAIWSATDSGGRRLIIDESKLMGDLVRIGFDMDGPSPVGFVFERRKWMELLRSRAKDL